MGRYLLPVLFSLVIAYPVYGVFAWKTVNTNNNLIKCLQHMIRNDNATFVRYVRISIKSDSKLDNWNFGEMANQLLASNDFDLMFEIQDINVDKSIEFTIHRRLFFVNSFETFKWLVQLQRSYAGNVSGNFQYFYVILPSNIRNLSKVLQQITQFCLENMIANVNILVEDIDGIVTIYSYYPFTSTSCRNSKPFAYNYYKNGRFTWKKPVFPPKLMNLWKCPLNVILWEEPPFVQNISHPGHMFGVDVSVLNYLATNMNFTWNVIISPLGPGEIYSNGTFTEGFEMLNDRLGDLMLSGTSFYSDRILNFAATKVYFFSSIQLIFKPSEKYSTLLILLFPFDQFTWLTILIVLAGKWIIQALWKMIANKFNERFSAQLLTIIWLMSILIFRSSYEGSIYKFLLDSPRKNLPQSFDEAIAEGYTFITKQAIYNLYGHNLKNRVKVIANMTNELFKEFHKFNGKYALVTRGEALTIFRNEISPLREEYLNWIIISEPILLSYDTIYLPKFSFLTSVLDSRISQMIESGFVNKIKQTLIENVLKRSMDSGSKAAQVKISMQHLSGIFNILAAMMVVAGCIFGIEIISIRVRKLRTILNFFHEN